MTTNNIRFFSETSRAACSDSTKALFAALFNLHCIPKEYGGTKILKKKKNLPRFLSILLAAAWVLTSSSMAGEVPGSTLSLPNTTSWRLGSVFWKDIRRTVTHQWNGADSLPEHPSEPTNSQLPTTELVSSFHLPPHSLRISPIPLFPTLLPRASTLASCVHLSPGSPFSSSAPGRDESSHRPSHYGS